MFIGEKRMGEYLDEEDEEVVEEVKESLIIFKLNCLLILWN